ncbi:hypothetical protein Tco_0855274 [Tanacetum coccineum]
MYTYYMSPGTKVGHHIDDFNKLILDLENIDIEIEDKDQALMLLTSLPSSYKNFMEILLYGKESLTMEDILATLNSRELKKRTEGTKSSRLKSTGGTGKAYFGEALVVVRNDEMNELVMDLCGSYHMTQMRDFLYDVKGFNGGSIQLGDNRTCTIKGTGKNRAYTLEAKVMTFGVQKHSGSKQVGFKELGHKQVGFKQLGPSVETRFHIVHVDKRVCFVVELEGAQRSREAEVFQVSNDDAAVAQRWLEDKQQAPYL